MNQALLSEPPSSTVRLPWTPGYEALGAPFVHPHRLQPVPEARTLVHSRALARELGLDEQWLRSQEAAEALAGNALLHGSQPVSSVYSGHQFGVWAGQLGDGRAVLLGTLDSPLGPQELQLKGAGLTPYSRMGDGRAVLRSSIREFLVSEAMHALGIPTTRALALVGSPAPVRREVMETAAVVTRVAPSFIRFGHFEHFWANQQIDALRTLSDFVIDRHLPGCRQADGNPHAELLRTVVARTAELIADWQAVGFCHGVMNTDNMSVLGLTIDYGPFQFLDGYDPGHICNHSDSGGRYAFGQQPAVAHWNLFCLAQAMLPLLDSQEQAIGILEGYGPAFAQAIRRRLKAKLGLRSDQPGDPQLFEAVYALLAHERTDHTIFWRRLGEARAAVANTPDWQAVADLFIDPAPWRVWLARYQARLSLETGEPSAPPMDRTNPSIVLRNHMAETAIQAAQAGDPSEVQRLHQALTRPFDPRPATDAYASFPPDWAHHIEISCSS